MPGIHVEHWGAGPPVLLVHGSVTGGAMTWDAQRPLAQLWHLFVVDRRGYFPNPPVEVEDFEVDAGDVAELLTEPMHLVGHSYGGVVALLAAAQRPGMVRSLTVNEPPAFGLLPDASVAELRRVADALSITGLPALSLRLALRDAEREGP